MMQSWIVIIFAIYCGTATAVANTTVLFEKIDNYKNEYKLCKTAENEPIVATRSFTSNKEKYFLVISTNLHTRVLKQKQVSCSNTSTTSKVLENHLLTQLSQVYSSNHEITLSAGYNFMFQQGSSITIDLCPSKLALSEDLFNDLAAQLPHPIEINIAISGGWIKHHEEELKWLLDKQNEKVFHITWVNHSFTHPYDHEKDWKDNFLLTSNLSIDEEIRLEEIRMLEHGLVPSVFFRFPGLVSNKETMQVIAKWHLIPLAANAWLAKNEMPIDGSIVLVHGNGNEPLGVHIMKKLLSQKKLPLPIRSLEEVIALPNNYNW